MNAGLLLLLASSVPALEPSSPFALAAVEGKGGRGVNRGVTFFDDGQGGRIFYVGGDRKSTRLNSSHRT